MYYFWVLFYRNGITGVGGIYTSLPHYIPLPCKWKLFAYCTFSVIFYSKIKETIWPVHCTCYNSLQTLQLENHDHDNSTNKKKSNCSQTTHIRVKTAKKVKMYVCSHCTMSELQWTYHKTQFYICFWQTWDFK